MQIIPAILATTEEQYLQDLKEIESCDELITNGWIQLDFMDNQFVQNEQSSFAAQNKSIGIDVIARNPTDLKIEAHLMVEYPENWIDELVKIDVKRIIFPLEDSEGIEERIKHIKNHGKEVGLSINPETKIEDLIKYLNNLSVLLIMSVNPGKQGQSFIPKIIEKIKGCSQLRSSNNLNFLIGVDGGVSSENVKMIVDAGADYVVVGSHLLKGDINLNLQKFKEALK